MFVYMSVMSSAAELSHVGKGDGNVTFRMMTIKYIYLDFESSGNPF